MARNFENFLDAYLDYAHDGFCPDAFHIWTGLSIISGALERKVWLSEHAGKVVYYPNTFILLVANPGTGKSTALNRGTALIHKLKERNQDFKILSGLATQAGLCEEMLILNAYSYEGLNGIQYSSVYYHASEASDSGLQNLHGDFNATITALYDCADSYNKRLKDKHYNIPNPSMCVLAGSTFDFLKTLVNQNSVMGGLASRFIYVVSRERKLRDPEAPELLNAQAKEFRAKLVEDLYHINRLVGAFGTTPETRKLSAAWFREHEEKFKKIESERMQSIKVREPTTLKKLCMLLSVAESDDLIIREHHFHRAVQLLDDVTKETAQIVSSAIIGNKNTQEAINQFLMQTMKAAGGKISIKVLKQKFLNYGGDISKYDPTIKMLQEAGAIKSLVDEIELLIDPDSNL